jgi:hypothetical protein
MLQIFALALGLSLLFVFPYASSPIHALRVHRFTLQNLCHLPRIGFLTQYALAIPHVRME